VQLGHDGAFSEKNRYQPSLSPASSLRLRLPFGATSSRSRATSTLLQVRRVPDRPDRSQRRL